MMAVRYSALRRGKGRSYPCNRLGDDEPNSGSGDVFDIDMGRYPLDDQGALRLITDVTEPPVTHRLLTLLRFPVYPSQCE